MRLIWFRRDLRVDDNTALISAIESGERIVAAFIATPETWREHHLAPIQADLIYRRLFCLKAKLEQLNIPLLYAEVDDYSSSAIQISDWVDRLQITAVHLNKEYEWDEIQRDNHLELLLSKSNAALHRHDDKCHLAPGDIVNQKGDYFKVFTPFKKAYLKAMQTTPLHVRKAKAVAVPMVVLPSKDIFGEHSAFSYPRISSEEFTVDSASIIKCLRLFVQDGVDDYKQQRDFPAVSGTSGLSPYLAIGALSVRQCLARVEYQQIRPLSAGRESWQSELIWREFYQHLLHFEPKLSKGRCFLPWGERLMWPNRDEYITAWKEGKTGYPIVDAAMRQLNQTGWMHNRLRMIVASFLIKDLHVDWRIGEAYFMSKLIDGEYAANNGGWQWCASTGCDGQPYFRIFNPTTQGERFDPNGDFVRHWIPELADVPAKYIHQPMKWNRVKEASYPSPIVDHKVQREITLANYKDAKDIMNAT